MRLVPAAQPVTQPASNATLVLELPRFNLEFEQILNPSGDSYELVANDYSGYSLASQQQLVRYSQDGSQVDWYTLPDFTQYLVLTRRAGLGGHAAGTSDVVVLVPEGEVQCVGRVVGRVESNGVKVAHS